MEDIIFKNIVKDPNNYLNADSVVGSRFLYRIGQFNYLRENNYKEMYNFVDKEYQDIINKTAIFIKELGLKDNHVSYFSIFSFLLWNGIFSKDNKYVYSADDTFDANGYFGLDIMYGKGNCKSNSDMMSKVFKKMGLNSYFLVNSCDIKSVDSTIDLKRVNIDENSLASLESDDSKLVGNHANVLVEDSYTNNFYVYDPTNLLIYNASNSMEASLYNGEGKCYFKPWGFILFEYMKTKEILELMDRIDKQDKLLSISDLEVRDTVRMSINKCKKEKSLILDFRKDINKNIDNINANGYYF